MAYGGHLNDGEVVMDTEKDTEKDELVLDTSGFDKDMELVAMLQGIISKLNERGGSLRKEWQQLIHDLKAQRRRVFEEKKRLEMTKKQASETLQSFTQSHRNLVDRLAEKEHENKKLKIEMEKMKEEYSRQTLEFVRSREQKPTPKRIRGEKAGA